MQKKRGGHECLLSWLVISTSGALFRDCCRPLAERFPHHTLCTAVSLLCSLHPSVRQSTDGLPLGESGWISPNCVFRWFMFPSDLVRKPLSLSLLWSSELRVVLCCCAWSFKKNPHETRIILFIQILLLIHAVKLMILLALPGGGREKCDHGWQRLPVSFSFSTNITFCFADCLS